MKKTGKLTATRIQLFIIILTALLCVNASIVQAQTTRYVKSFATGTGTGDGSSWANASIDLQIMINNSSNGDMIFVAAGYYMLRKMESLSMKEGVKIYGGFAGTEIQLSQRDWVTNKTILWGSYAPVLYNDVALHLTAAAVLDGFSITGGYSGLGGGMHNDSCSPTISNCTFYENNAGEGAGGGMYNQSCSPTISNCIFSSNSSGLGGGIHNNMAAPTIINCTFNSNKAFLGPGNTGGGGIYNARSSPVITGCNFTLNEARSYGGAIYNETGSSPVISNCTFQQNKAQRGGAIYNIRSAPSITSCSFSVNRASVDAGAIANIISSPAMIASCNFSGNTANDGSGGAMLNDQSSPVIRYCFFSGNSAKIGAVMINEKANATISNCVFSGNWSSFAGGTIRNILSSPVIASSTFAGNHDLVYRGSYGSSVLCNTDNSAPVVSNCIIWGNSGAIYNENVGYKAPSTTTIQYSIVQGGYPGIGNQAADPLFINAPDFNSAPFTGGDYRMRVRRSPGINTGNNRLVPPGITTDMAGKPRIIDLVVDQGAYEYGVVPKPK